MKSCKKCANPLIEKKGTFTHVIFGKDVIVEDVPYTTCEKCGDVEYLSTRKVDFLIRDAYRANLESVKFV